MNFKLLVILLGVGTGILLLFDTAFAGWSDHSPVPVNSTQNPGVVDPHTNSGGRRVVRISGTTIVIAPHRSRERTYRSTDNGTSWTEIDTDGWSSGCLITGPQEMVYHFYSFDDHIYMVRFKYDETPPAPVSIYTHPDLSETVTGAYHAVNAIVDANGVLYVATHWGSPDRLYLLRSSDSGDSWTGPYEISSGSDPWYYPHLEVTSDNILVCTYANFRQPNRQIWFAKSTDLGKSWERVLVSDDETLNPSILTIGAQIIFVFAQSYEPAHTGLVFKFSNNSGNTWRGGWSLIDPTCGYADPSPGLGSDGQTIYVAYRSSNGTGVTSGSCGDQSRSRLVMSPDLGQTWQFVDNYYNAERTGTRSQIRYQTWWNYGGPLEWIWMQYEDGGTNRPIYYDINVDVDISANPPAASMADFSGGPRTGKAPLEVQFTDSSAGEIDSWAWNFGDGGTSMAQNATHTYDIPGTYTVTLEVLGPDGSDTYTRNNYIKVTAVHLFPQSIIMLLLDKQ